MRTIKFRAWHTEDKFMFTVRQIDFGLLETGDSAKFYVWADKLRDDDEWIKFFGDEVELMQLIGLIDKEGRDIYEGDICKTPDGKIIEVGIDTPYQDWVVQPLIVIGNKWENPEIAISKP